VLDYKKQIIRPFILASLLLSAALAGLLFAAIHLVHISRQAEQTDVLRIEAIKLHKAIVQVETGQRGYLLTQNVRFLENYRKGKADIKRITHTLNAQMIDVPDIKHRFEDVSKLVEIKLRVTEASIQTEINSGAYAPHLNSAKIGVNIMDRIDTELEDIDDLLQRRKSELSDDSRRALKQTMGGAALLLLIVIGLFTGAYYKTVRLFEIASTSQTTAEEMSHDAYHDSLTGLPNRRYFESYFRRQIFLSKRSGQPFSLFYLDLDGFKEINDRHGHDGGDLALKFVTERFKNVLRESDFIARLGGDEFVVLVHNYRSVSEIGGLGNRIIRYINQPFTIDGQHQLLGVSIGISCYPMDGQEADELLDAADRAMYQAKKNGKNRLVFSQD
jgi:diguanylate cyclase